MEFSEGFSRGVPSPPRGYVFQRHNFWYAQIVFEAKRLYTTYLNFSNGPHLGAQLESHVVGPWSTMLQSGATGFCCALGIPGLPYWGVPLWDLGMLLTLADCTFCKTVIIYMPAAVWKTKGL